MVIFSILGDVVAGKKLLEIGGESRKIISQECEVRTVKVEWRRKNIPANWNGRNKIIQMLSGKNSD